MKTSLGGAVLLQTRFTTDYSEEEAGWEEVLHLCRSGGFGGMEEQEVSNSGF